jgi:sarcosine oxidase delta subunit
MATYTLINSNVLSSSAASVTFSSIPATYTDLVLKAATRGDDGAVSYADVFYWFNNDRGSKYSWTYLSGSGTAASSSRNAATTEINMYRVGTRAGATANTFGSWELYIPNYAGTTGKPVSTFGASENNTTAAYITAEADYISLTSAITRIDIGSYSTNFVSGSSFYLYGISNA